MNIKTKKQNKTFHVLKSTSGFAMLYAVLVSSLLLAIGISIFNISIKELNIATSERDSQLAFYASDSAIECADDWRRRGDNS